MEQTRLANLWPYSERNGATAYSDMAVLLAPPEQFLDDTERVEAARFAHGLYNGTYGDLRCESERTLKQIRDISTDESSQTFYCDYFRSPEGQADLRLLGLPDASNEEVQALLSDVSRMQATVDAKTRKEISARSTDWYRTILAARLAADPRQDMSYVEPDECTVNYSPDKLLDKFADLQAYRRFYRKVWQEMKGQPETPLFRAQCALLEVHTAWVNNKVADLYPSVWDLAVQLDSSQPSETTDAWEVQLRSIAPVIMGVFRHREEGSEQAIAEYFDGFARRLDMVRNGASHRTGDYSAVNEELVTLADAVDSSEMIILPEAVQFSEDELAVMDMTVWTADDLQHFNKDVLGEWGLLSEYDADWEAVQSRDGCAPDGKWQVVVTPKKKSLSVEGAKKVLWIPKTFKRRLTQESPAGGLPVSAHEEGHIWQTEFDIQVAEQIPLAELKGRRYVTVREMGGIAQERTVQAAFGRTRATNVHYLRALQVKEAGGMVTEATRAFYDSYTGNKRLDAAADKEARDTAADRVLRLYRHGGHDSQPLDYLEQDLLVAAMAELDDAQRQAVIIAGGSLSWNDAAKLHRVGLFELPSQVHIDPAATVLRIFRARYLPALMQRAA